MEPKPLTRNDLMDMTNSQIELHKHKLKHYKESKHEEVSKYMINKRLKPLLVR